MIRIIIIGLSVLLFSACSVNKKSINHLIVHKSKREMLLYSDNTLLKKVPIALGSNPVNPKEREGDGRTPEGHYFIAWRNPNSQYYLSLNISYPNNRDLLRAQKNGHSAGGQIMIHGLPKKPKWENEEDYITKDWTNGCIAVSNDVMKELFDRVVINSPIDIYP